MRKCAQNGEIRISWRVGRVPLDCSLEVGLFQRCSAVFSGVQRCSGIKLFESDRDRGGVGKPLAERTTFALNCVARFALVGELQAMRAFSRKMNKKRFFFQCQNVKK